MRVMHMQWEPSLSTQELRDTIRDSVVREWGNVGYTFTQTFDDDSILITELSVRLGGVAPLTDTMVRAFTDKVRSEYIGNMQEDMGVDESAQMAVYHSLNVLHDEARTGVELVDKYIQEYIAI